MQACSLQAWPTSLTNTLKISLEHQNIQALPGGIRTKFWGWLEQNECHPNSAYHQEKRTTSRFLETPGKERKKEGKWRNFKSFEVKS